MRKSTTPKWVASSLASLPRVGCVTLANPALSKVQPRWGNGTPRGLVEIGRGGACVPARVALQGRIHRSIPRTQCVMYKTYFRYGNAAARPRCPARAHPSFIPCTQCVYFCYGNAATRTFGRAHRHRPYGFVWGDCA